MKEVSIRGDSLSPGTGVPVAVNVTFGDPLTSWPTGFYVEGIDWFDTDLSCKWTPGDDLHVEGPAHPTALRGGTHDDLLDPIVLDLDGSLDLPPDQEPVHVDLEFGLPNPSGIIVSSCTGPDPALMFYDGGGNGFWDDGEDIVIDLNGNGICD